MKLVIQIPCLNEEESLGKTLAELPTQIPGIAQIYRIVIDDGSTDRTAEIAREAGVDYLVRFPKNVGLAAAFRQGLVIARELQADILVNIDADGQYAGYEISNLIDPIMRGRADLAVGSRPVHRIAHATFIKRFIYVVGAQIIRILCQTHLPDPTSGFRALSRKAMETLSVTDPFTYTLETLVQCNAQGLRIENVPVSARPVSRPSRIVKSVPRYVGKSLLTLWHASSWWNPFYFFMLVHFTLITVTVHVSLLARLVGYKHSISANQNYFQLLFISLGIVTIGRAISYYLQWEANSIQGPALEKFWKRSAKAHLKAKSAWDTKKEKRKRRKAA